MPRRKTIQPDPKVSWTLDDGTVVEIRDHQSREIGRGLERKSRAEELDWQVLTGLVDDMQSGNFKRVIRANEALASNHALARYLLDGGYELDERTARRHGKSIREKYQQMMTIAESAKKGSAPVHPAPCPNS